MADEAGDRNEVAAADSENKVIVSRQAFTQDEFDQDHHHVPRHSKTVKERISDYKNSCGCSWTCRKQKGSTTNSFLAVMVDALLLRARTVVVEKMEA